MCFCLSHIDICNFVDDSTIISCGIILGDILHNLKFDSGYISKWFEVNLLKPNPGKFQLMILRLNTNIKANLIRDGNKIEKSQEVILLGITIDVKF